MAPQHWIILAQHEIQAAQKHVLIPGQVREILAG
jgi:hypothetical protein